LEYFSNNKPWDRKTLIKPLTAKESIQSHGVVLVEILEDRRIKFEAFPQKTQVNDFTNNAKYFVR